MPVFMVERRFADVLEVDAGIAEGINRINDDEDVRWLYSFLSADKRKTYCLYEAPSAEAIRRAAERAGLDLAKLDAEALSDAAALDAEIAASQAALEAAGHWGVPTLVFDGEPFFGQDRIDLAVWRMQQKGLSRR